MSLKYEVLSRGLESQGSLRHRLLQPGAPEDPRPCSPHHAARPGCPSGLWALRSVETPLEGEGARPPPPPFLPGKQKSRAGGWWDGLSAWGSVPSSCSLSQQRMPAPPANWGPHSPLSTRGEASGATAHRGPMGLASPGAAGARPRLKGADKPPLAGRAGHLP